MSGVLVDTHIALWALGDPARLTVEERSLMVDPTIDRCLSPVSVWEAAIKREKGRLRAPRHLSALLGAEFRLLEVRRSCSKRPRSSPATTAIRSIAP